MADISIDTDLARKILTGFIRTELNRAGFSKAVLGLSGGIDSALACYLAAEALGKEGILAVRMPYKTSAQDSLDDAQQVIDALGIQSLTVPITEMVDPLFERFLGMENRRKGNIMARERMIILFDQSEAFHGLVVGTSNKTEILLGYSTWYGDSACAINPIGDLYKAQVRELAQTMGVPKSIIEKAPSADLWAGQTDEGELGFTYDQADQILYLLIDQRYTPQEVVDASFREEFVKAILQRVRRNQFKRILPPIAKLSNRTIGYDFLYLRDWGT